ncbi:type II toxin-antitoxin system RelE/ParE family toxin [Adlercreutzia equolifaciens]|uniref:type II toxin-antitoxin system RelE/ParE family toxin n=1 Tax=Adlercreutzia equolifaciens TaxID=446660 RepID=UPI0023AF80C4|nr:type II toxin-antitoxin system RelE/ParE family toxin [Adlercreutzia equolifaciens]MDE8701569.1 type II toxin-antitoxin system RelE/ParE family toxin [Adlercreutzia equolifaciens]
MPNFCVEFYETPQGTFPAEEFIDEQDSKMQAKLYRLIELLEIKGSELREPYSKALRDGIFELRAQQGGDRARVLYFFVVGRRVILTNGFIKKTPKTPLSEIETARRARDAFMQNEVK